MRNMVEIANPIFDIVFKYLMEDESIALTFLSALLKKEVISVEMRRNEYSNQMRDNLSNFRIDFGARVRETDGSERLILIELQKNRLESVLSVFNQSLIGESRQILNIDEASYGDDSELTRIIRRLQSAAANREIRHNMTVEEEFFSAIDTRYAAIAACYATIASRDATIAERDSKIADRDSKISSQESIIADSCRLLLKSGMTFDEISKSLKMDQQQLRDLLDKSKNRL